MIVAAALLALLVVAIATRAPISVEVGDSGGARQSYVAFVIDVIATGHLFLRKGKPLNPRGGCLYVATTVDLVSGSTESDPLHLTQI